MNGIGVGPVDLRDFGGVIRYRLDWIFVKPPQTAKKAKPVLYPEMPIVDVVGSGIAHAVPLTLIAGLGHWALGSINWQLLESLLIGSIPGIIFGSMLSSRIPETVVRVTLSVTLILICAKFWFF